MKRATIELTTKCIGCFMHHWLLACRCDASAKIPTLAWLDRKNIAQQCTHACDVIVTRSSVRVACMKLKHLNVSHIITNTIRHEKQLNMTTYLITRNVTTLVDNHAGCGGGVRISIHRYCNTMHHICITKIEESCTCKLATSLYIAHRRRIIALTDWLIEAPPQVFTITQCQMFGDLGVFNKN